jgi:hypothetical protein
LALAGFGYIYTVIPIYQKEVLSEQIAAKEIESKKLQRSIEVQHLDLTRLAASIKNLEAVKIRLEQERAFVKDELATLEKQLKEQIQASEALRLEKSKVEAQAKDLDGKLFSSGQFGMAVTLALATIAELYGEAIDLQASDPLPQIRRYIQSGDGFPSAKTIIERNLRAVEDGAKSTSKVFSLSVSRDAALASAKKIRRKIEAFKGKPLAPRKANAPEYLGLIQSLLKKRDEEKRRQVLINELTSEEVEYLRIFVALVIADQAIATIEFLESEFN